MASYAGGSGGKSSLGSSSLSSGLIILRGRFDKGSESGDAGSGSSAEGTLVYLVLNGFGSLIMINGISSGISIQKGEKYRKEKITNKTISLQVNNKGG